MKFDGGKYMFATVLVEEMRDQSNVLEEICVSVFSYGINDLDNNIKRKGRQLWNVDSER